MFILRQTYSLCSAAPSPQTKSGRETPVWRCRQSSLFSILLVNRTIRLSQFCSLPWTVIKCEQNSLKTTGPCYSNWSISLNPGLKLYVSWIKPGLVSFDFRKLIFVLAFSRRSRAVTARKKFYKKEWCTRTCCFAYQSETHKG